MQLYRRNKKYYYVKYLDENGCEVRVSTSKIRKDEALKVVSDVKKNLNSTKRKVGTLESISSEYLKHIKIRLSKKYFVNMSSTLSAFSKYIGIKHIDSVKKHSISSFIDQKIISGKLHQANQHFRNLRTFFNWAVDNDYINQSPIDRMKPPKLPEKKPTWITVHELDIILSNVNSSQLKDVYQILFYTGMRASELLSMTWSNINLEEKLIFIRNSQTFTTKSGKERAIPMNDKVYNIIYRQPTRFRGELLFLKNGFIFSVDYISKQFKKALRNTGLNEDIHLHSLRHSFASNLMKEGANIYFVSKLLGHAKVSTTEIYAHVKTEDLRKSIELLNN